MYSSGDLSRLRDIRYFRDLKFSLREISRLLDAPPERVVAAMEQQFHVVEQALKEYRRAYAALDSILGAGGVQSRAAGHLAVIGIDLQNDILQGGALPCRRIEGLIPALSALYQDARRRNIPIIYVCDCHKQGDPELELWNDHMMEGTWGAQIIQELAPQPGDFIVNKNLFNGFVNTCLQTVLDGLGARTLLFTGWRTDVCVAQTAIEAFYRGFRVAIAEDGVNSTTESEHRQGLAQMQINYNFQMLPCAAALDRLMEYTDEL